MKKLFLFLLISLAALDSSAIGFMESNSLAKGRTRYTVVNKVEEKGKVLELPATSWVKAETKTISNSVVGLVTDFFSKVFSIFFGDYMSLSLDATPTTCLKVDKC